MRRSSKAGCGDFGLTSAVCRIVPYGTECSSSKCAWGDFLLRFDVGAPSSSRDGGGGTSPLTMTEEVASAVRKHMWVSTDACQLPRRPAPYRDRRLVHVLQPCTLAGCWVAPLGAAAAASKEQPPGVGERHVNIGV